MTLLQASDFFLLPTSKFNKYSQATSISLADGRVFTVFLVENKYGERWLYGRVHQAEEDPTGEDFAIQAIPNDPWNGESSLFPKLVQLPDGNVFVAWTRNSGALNDVIGRIFSADGQPLGPEVLVNLVTDFGQSLSNLVLVADGSVLATYTSNHQSAGNWVSDTLTLGRFFDGNGQPLGAEFALDVLGDNIDILKVIPLADGGVLLSYAKDDQAASSWNTGTYYRILPQGANVWGPEVQVSSGPRDEVMSRRTIVMANGDVLFTGISRIGPDHNSTEFEFSVRVLASDGNLSEIWTGVDLAQMGRLINHDVAQLADGTLVVAVWGITWQIDRYGQNYMTDRGFLFQLDPAGQQIGNIVEFTPEQVFEGQQVVLSGVDLTAMADGRLLVTWASNSFVLNGNIPSPVVGQYFVFGAQMAGTATDERLAGGDMVDQMHGAGGNDTLVGLDGADTLIGGGGRDRMEGGRGDDLCSVNHQGDLVVEAARSGTDWVRASISVTLWDNVENLKLLTAQPLSATGNAMSNKIVGNGQNNMIQGLGRADALSGRSGDDTIRGGSGDDSLIGHSGNDQLFGGAGNDTLRGDRDFDPDRDDDRLFGGSGDDLLWSDSGSDSMMGGTGADTFVFTARTDRGVFASDPFDVFEIADFSRQEGDRIDMSAIGGPSTVLDHQDFAFIGAAEFSGSGAELRFEDGILYGNFKGGRAGIDLMLILRGVTNLTAADLIL